MPKNKLRYQMGYADGSGSDDTIYDVKLKKPIAVVTWGCTCCACPQPDDKEFGNLIVAALNAYKPKKSNDRKKNSTKVGSRRSSRSKAGVR